MQLFHGLPKWCNGKESACHCRKCKRFRLDLWIRKIVCNRKWQSAPVFLPEKFHGQRSPVDYSPWGHKESDTAERLHLWAIEGSEGPPPPKFPVLRKLHPEKTAKELVSSWGALPGTLSGTLPLALEHTSSPV